MDYNWKPFNEAYRTTDDKTKFYQTGVTDLARAAAEKSAKKGETVQERLGLLTQDKLLSATPFNWTQGKNSPVLSQALADFAKRNGSKKPTFDAMLCISRLVKLCAERSFNFNPDESKEISITIKSGYMELKYKDDIIISDVPVIEEIAISEETEKKKTKVKVQSEAARTDIREEVEIGNIATTLSRIFDDSQSDQFSDEMAEGLNALRYNWNNGAINLDKMYLALVDAHKGRSEDLADYVSQYTIGLEIVLNNPDLYPERNDEDFKNINVLIDILNTVEWKYLRASLTEEGRTLTPKKKSIQSELFNPKTNAFIQSVQPEIATNAEGLYDQLGLDPNKIHKDPAVFLEMAIRRERNIQGIDDKLQEFAAEYWKMDPDGSIGALGIQPRTYVAALLLKNGIEPLPKENFEGNLKMAEEAGLLTGEEEILTNLKDPAQAIEMFTWILKMEMPKPGDAIEIRLSRPGVDRKPYKLPIQETYTFATEVIQKENKENGKEEIVGGSMTFTYDELRLLSALAKYQGKGLDLVSKDSNVRLNETEEITQTENLVLNNRTTYCLAS